MRDRMLAKSPQTVSDESESWPLTDCRRDMHDRQLHASNENAGLYYKPAWLPLPPDLCFNLSASKCVARQHRAQATAEIVETPQLLFATTEPSHPPSVRFPCPPETCSQESTSRCSSQTCSCLAHPLPQAWAKQPPRPPWRPPPSPFFAAPVAAASPPVQMCICSLSLSLTRSLLYACMHACVSECVHTHTERDTERDTHTHTQTQTNGRQQTWKDG